MRTELTTFRLSQHLKRIATFISHAYPEVLRRQGTSYHCRDTDPDISDTIRHQHLIIVHWPIADIRSG